MALQAMHLIKEKVPPVTIVSAVGQKVEKSELDQCCKKAVASHAK